MMSSMRSLGDRILGTLLGTESAAACTIAKCTTSCDPHGETNCEYICTQTCKSSSGQVCYTDSYCSN